MKFAYIYALPGYVKAEKHKVVTQVASFYAVAVPMERREMAAEVARQLLDDDAIDMIELCGGLANAEHVALVKHATGNRVPVGAVYYGPESRRPLVDLLNL